MQYIECRDLKLHNLKNISVNIPKGQLTVITGVSGSGKSTFAFDILAHVGQTKYLSAIGMLPEREVVSAYNIIGLSPTVHVSQNLKRQSNPRSTIGSRTGMLSLLQSLFVEIGEGNTSGIQLEPSMFSNNSAMGLCFNCYGKGFVKDTSQMERDVLQGFLKDKRPIGQALHRLLRAPFKQYCKLIGDKDSFNLSFSQLSTKLKEVVIYGDTTIYFKGTVPYYKQFVKDEKTSDNIVCDVCDATGLRLESLAIKIDGKNIAVFRQMNIKDLYNTFLRLKEKQKENTAALHIITTLIALSNNLISSNLDYVTLDRKVPTLSGGEFQRLLLSSFFDLGLNDMTYIFDEPTMGLHESEKRLIIQKIKQLKSKGNTIIVVEHDLGVLEEADYIVEFGRGGGIEGGNITFRGSYLEFISSESSVIRQAMKQIALSPPVLLSQSKALSENNLNEYISLEHITVNNLNDITVSIPLYKLVGVAGVSGSGKSSLISQGLVPLLNIEEDDGDDKDESEYVKQINGATIKNSDKIKRALYVIQKPIGRSKKSIVASYVGIWDNIRLIYAEAAKKMGRKYKVGHFSFNSEGACKKCGGNGTINMAGVDFICDTCGGTKYNPEVLEVSYKGYNINEIQSITVKEAASIFDNANILKVVDILNDMCLGYLTLGQSTKTISGGEAQRIKLAVELCTQNAVDFMYVLDEPTSGLSCQDILALSDILKRLVAKGNTVIVIEHDLQLLSICDHIIEMGPKSGRNGGRIIAQGNVDEVITNKNSIIAPYFQQFINNVRG